MKLGRIGVTSGEPELEDPVSWDTAAQQVRIGQTFYGADTSVLDNKALRDQVQGLVDNPDEPVVPLVWDQDGTTDGFWRVVGGSVETTPQSFNAGGGWSYSLDLERVPHSALPGVESVLLGGFRSNSVSLATSVVDPWHTIPEARIDYWDGFSDFQQNAIATLVAESGTVVTYEHAATTPTRRTPHYAIPASNWYDGATRIEVDYSGTGDYYTAVGRQVYDGSSAVAWRLTNGLLRVSPSTTAGTAGRLTVEAYNGGSWAYSHDFKFIAYDGVTAYIVERFNSFAIERNSPEEAIIRLTAGLTSSGYDYAHRTTLDLSLRRGSRMVDGLWAISGGTGILGGIQSDVTQYGTAITGGGYGTADATYRPMILATTNATYGNTSNSLTDYSNGQWSFGFGVQIVGEITALNQRDRWFAPYSETQTVVGW